MWMCLAKFSLCNRLSLTALTTLFVAKRDDAPTVDLRHAARWNLQALATVLEITDEDVRAGFCARTPCTAPGDASDQLRHCPACLEAGFHAAWFQWPLVERCPLHRLPLRTGCIECAAPVSYALGAELASSPLSCASCGCAWVPGLSRPAGQCTPLDHRTGRLLARWARYVEHVMAEESFRRRRRRSGWPGPAASPSAVPRPHPLTMVNRLFDVPPPLTAQWLRQRACKLQYALLSVPTPIKAVPHQALYRSRDWPHFERRFAQCEQAVRAAGRQLFGDIDEECERGRWRCLLATDLTASSDTMDSDTAAALGWAVSWTSCLQALAPGTVRPMPALGLAAWLASLPVHRPHTPKHQCQAQVLAWLAEDLEASAQMWRRLAAFMKAKGVYLLRSALVDLPELARRHEPT